MDGDFAGLQAATGRPSIPPKQVLKALLLQAFYTVRSERQLMEQLDYILLFRWFVGLGIDDAVWHPTVFSKNPDRLLDGDIARRFLAAVTGHAQVRGLLSDDQFSVNGRLIEAWASVKRFRPKDGDDGPPGPGRNGERDFHGERRTNERHASTTDPDAKLYRKGPGKEPNLPHMGHLLMENRCGLVLAAWPTPATGRHRITLGADWGYDTGDFVATLRTLNVTAHVAQNTSARRSRIDGRTTRHPGYATSQRARKRIEEAFGWIKVVAGQRKTRFCGSGRVGWAFTLAGAAYNLIRLPKLLAA